ncbi:MAG: hypothetical protein NC218_08030 [Acetobacter sp.]|nr:hypothetical protein [Acetobacter sp.]
MNIRNVKKKLSKRRKYLGGFDIIRAIDASELKHIGIAYRCDIHDRDTGNKFAVWEFFDTNNNKAIKDRQVLNHISKAEARKVLGQCQDIYRKLRKLFSDEQIKELERQLSELGY